MFHNNYNFPASLITRKFCVCHRNFNVKITTANCNIFYDRRHYLKNNSGI